MSRSSDSYLKSLPPSGPYQRRIARYRMKGYHAETVPGDGNELDASAVYSPFPPWWPGVPNWARDDTTNNSDKSFTVPTGKVWDMKMLLASFVASADVGNRILLVTITDGTKVIWASRPSAAIAATTAASYYINTQATDANTRRLISDVGTASAVAGGDIWPRLLLMAGYVVRIYDAAAVAVAADDLTVVLHYMEYDAP